MSIHIAESRQWLGGSPVMHRNRLTSDSLSVAPDQPSAGAHEAAAD
jgi:hypothetical protein